jgi:hypothetical protein
MKQCCLCGKSGHEASECGWRGYRKVSLSSEISRLERRLARRNGQKESVWHNQN